MGRSAWIRAAAGAGLVVGAVTTSLLSGSATATTALDPNSSIVPATCGPGSLPEHGLQGQVPRADRNSGRSLKGYRCNLTLVGQYQGQGSGVISPSYKNCVYFGTFFPQSQFAKHKGVVVVDVKDPAHPRFVESLNTPAFIGGTWESLKVDPVHGYLAATGVEIPPGTGGLTFDLYSIKDDCTHPKLLNRLGRTNLSIPTLIAGHEGMFSPDGRTYYATSGGGQVTAIDVSKPTNPRTLYLGTVNLTNHGFSISPDGKTMYGVSLVPPGIQILDISDIQARKPHPAIREIGRLHWTDGFFSQHTIPFTKNGHPYLYAVDEGGTGAIHLIDIANPRKPKLLRVYRLEIQQPSARAARIKDEAGSGIFGYDAHYCTINRKTDPTRLACSYWQSGVRLYDVSNLMKPKELAYFDPPAYPKLVLNNTLANSPHLLINLLPPVLDYRDLSLQTLIGALKPNVTTDYCSSPPTFHGTNQLWVSCMDNGLMVLKYTPPR